MHWRHQLAARAALRDRARRGTPPQALARGRDARTRAPQRAEQRRCRSGEGEEEVLDAEELVFEGFLLFFGFREKDAEVVGHGEAGGAGDARLAGEEVGEILDEGFGAIGAEGLFEEGTGDAAFLVHEGGDEVSGLEFRVAHFGGEGLGGLDGLGGFVGEAFGVHAWKGVGGAWSLP